VTVDTCFSALYFSSVFNIHLWHKNWCIDFLFYPFTYPVRGFLSKGTKILTA